MDLTDWILGAADSGDDRWHGGYWIGASVKQKRLTAKEVGRAGTVLSLWECLLLVESRVDNDYCFEVNEITAPILAKLEAA